MTAEVYKSVKRLTSVNAVWTWNSVYHEIHQQAKSLVKKDTCMKYYDVRKPLYLETDSLGVGLGATLLQVRDDLSCRYDEVQDSARIWPFTFVSKNLSSTEQQYNNIEREAWAGEVPPLLFCMPSTCQHRT